MKSYLIKVTALWIIHVFFENPSLAELVHVIDKVRTVSELNSALEGNEVVTDEGWL